MATCLIKINKFRLFLPLEGLFSGAVVMVLIGTLNKAATGIVICDRVFGTWP